MPKAMRKRATRSMAAPRYATNEGRSTSSRRANGSDSRIASRGKRDGFMYMPSIARLPNPDPTLRKFSTTSPDIGLYTKIIQQFAFIGGYCAQWVDRVLSTSRAIKPAKVDDPEQQKVADAAALRASRAWARVRNRQIVLQKLLMGRFYGFSRAEKVWRFDLVVKEWIQDLYDVPWEAWQFDDQGRDFLRTMLRPFGTEVDSSRFIHFQWGSADTKYGAAVLSEVYLALWYIQQIQEFGLQAIEDYSKLIAIVHIPRGLSKEDRKKALTSVAEQYRYYVTVPTDETKISIETPTISVAANGTAGRSEYEVIRFYERWIQIRMLGAPQTQDKQLGTGKVEETRAGIWEDKPLLGSSALDQCLTEWWLDQYCEMNLADLPVELRPRFESDATGIESGLTGIQAQNFLEICKAFVAKQITATATEEGIVALGIPRARAKTIVESIANERKDLTVVTSGPPTQPPPANQNPPADQQPPGANKGKLAIHTDRGVIYLDMDAKVKTRNRGFIEVKELEVTDEWIIPKTVAA